MEIYFEAIDEFFRISRGVYSRPLVIVGIHSSEYCHVLR